MRPHNELGQVDADSHQKRDQPNTDITVQDYLFGRKATVWVFALLCLLMIFDFADRMIIASLLPYIQHDWAINDAQAGFLSSILTIGMVLFAFPVSIVIDRWRRIKTASLMGIFWGIASAAGAITQSFSQLAATRLLVGAGEAAYAPASYAWISAAFPHRRLQLALGLFSASQPIGMAIGIALGGLIAQHFGWRYALGVMAIPGIVIALLLYKGRDYRTILPKLLPAQVFAGKALDSASSSTVQQLTHRQVIRQNWQSIRQTPSLLLTYLAAAMATLQWVPIVFFLPSYLHRVHQIELATASLLTSSILLIGIVTLPLGGWVMDRLTQKYPSSKLYIAAGGYALATLLYVLAFSLVSGLWLQFALIIVAGALLTFCSSAPLSLTQELVSPSARALSGTTSVMTIHLLGSIPGPFIAGLLSDSFGLTVALTVLPLVSGVLATVLILFALRYYRKDFARVERYPLEAA
ncbi:MFS transporter [Acinetobacter populi]|uniref:MFS transporter n=1 Tax=Acinetobacter populi TaxID=1582270 RepID=A0A1Z9YVE2_9GAMM|nr:MFS transporter [Acinetobacter populi]OUY06165.1 MFS transporter [Acinetobacter populi]